MRDCSCSSSRSFGYPTCSWSWSLGEVGKESGRKAVAGSEGVESEARSVRQLRQGWQASIEIPRVAPVGRDWCRKVFGYTDIEEEKVRRNRLEAAQAFVDRFGDDLIVDVETVLSLRLVEKSKPEIVCLKETVTLVIVVAGFVWKSASV